LHRFNRLRRWPERVLVRSQFNAVHAALQLSLPLRFSGLVRSQAPNMRGNKLAEITHELISGLDSALLSYASGEPGRSL